MERSGLWRTVFDLPRSYSMSEMLFVGENDGDGFGGIGICMNADVGDKVA